MEGDENIPLGRQDLLDLLEFFILCFRVKQRKPNHLRRGGQ
jgi:hypothetical protein